MKLLATVSSTHQAPQAPSALQSTRNRRQAFVQRCCDRWIATHRIRHRTTAKLANISREDSLEQSIEYLKQMHSRMSNLSSRTLTSSTKDISTAVLRVSMTLQTPQQGKIVVGKQKLSSQTSIKISTTHGLLQFRQARQQGCSTRYELTMVTLLWGVARQTTESEHGEAHSTSHRHPNKHLIEPSVVVSSVYKIRRFP